MVSMVSWLAYAALARRYQWCGIVMQQSRIAQYIMPKIIVLGKVSNNVNHKLVVVCYHLAIFYVLFCFPKYSLDSLQVS